MFKRVVVATLLLIAFSLSVVSVGFAKNNPTWLKEKDPVDHPWGGDDNNNPDSDDEINPGPVNPYPYQFVYGGGDKSGLLISLFEVAWIQVRGFVFHVTAESTVVNNGATSPSGGKVGE
ncbi:MAG TPA: hypothetical protein VLB27_03150 [candidate division Zixibacteria bacterium]|nr:hypothetical protein [candidate division Zixibacteria bacterium]